jgi:YndJ-like protein
MTTQTITKWEQASALFGALVWAVLTGMAGMRKAPLGVIELLFLFAPLVIVPVGLALGRMVLPLNDPTVQFWLSRLQPAAAICTVISFWLAPGWMSGIFAIPWLLFCGVIALAGALTLRRPTSRSLVTWAVNIGRIDLAVAGGWLAMSRLGMRPLGIQEPIGILTAVHFHYTCFAAALLAGTLLAHTRSKKRQDTILKFVVPLVMATPFVVAAGFVYSTTLKMAAALVLSASIVALAMVQLWASRSLSARVSRIYIGLSAMSVVVGMVLASVYAIGDWLKQDWLLILRTASTHGLLNGLGFSLLGLLGWTIERSLSSTQT